MKYLHEYLNESMNGNEAESVISNAYDNVGDATDIASCWHWLDYLKWKKMPEKKYAKMIPTINDDIDSDYALETYAPVMVAMVTLGREKTYKYLESFIDKKELSDFDIKL